MSSDHIFYIFFCHLIDVLNEWYVVTLRIITVSRKMILFNWNVQAHRRINCLDLLEIVEKFDVLAPASVFSIINSRHVLLIVIWRDNIIWIKKLFDFSLRNYFTIERLFRKHEIEYFIELVANKNKPKIC